MYEIRLGPDAQEELRGLAIRVRTRITAAMRRELVHRPALDVKPRKRLRPDPDSGISAGRPVWQLRVGDHRVFYDVDVGAKVVMVQRVLHKGRRTTREILR